MESPPRPPFVGSTRDLQQELRHRGERFLVARLGAELGLERIGVNHETIDPGGSSSRPHAHSDDEEFVFVLAGEPTLWVDGHVSRLAKGDAVAFPAGTGIAHCLLNETDAPIELLIVGEHSPEDRVAYPLDPDATHPRPWRDAPTRPLGPHPGRAGVSDEA